MFARNVKWQRRVSRGPSVAPILPLFSDKRLIEPAPILWQVELPNKQARTTASR